MKISFDNLEELSESRKIKLTSKLLDITRILETVDPDLIASCLNEYLPYTGSNIDRSIADTLKHKALSSAIYKHTEQEAIPYFDDLLRNQIDVEL